MCFHVFHTHTHKPIIHHSTQHPRQDDVGEMKRILQIIPGKDHLKYKVNTKHNVIGPRA